MQSTSHVFYLTPNVFLHKALLFENYNCIKVKLNYFSVSESFLAAQAVFKEKLRNEGRIQPSGRIHVLKRTR